MTYKSSQAEIVSSILLNIIIILNKLCFKKKNKYFQWSWKKPAKNIKEKDATAMRKQKT